MEISIFAYIKQAYIAGHIGKEYKKLENTVPAGCILFFMPVEILNFIGKHVYFCGLHLLVLHFKNNQNGESGNERYKIYYCR